MTDDVDSTELAVGAEDLEVHRSTGGIEPSTRRWIVAALATIALAALVAEIILAIVESSSSEALLTVAATAVGALGGMAVPGQR